MEAVRVWVWIFSGIAHLHFDDQSKQVVSLFFSSHFFSKRNRKHVLHVSIKL